MTKWLRSLRSAFQKQVNIKIGLMFFAVLAWLSVLYSSDSFLSPYVLCALFGMVSFVENVKHNVSSLSRRTLIWSNVFAVLFSLAVFLANYQIISPMPAHFLKCVTLLLGGFLIGRHSLLFSLNIRTQTNQVRPKSSHALRWFWLSFLAIALIDLLALFFCYKPGILTPDSIDQITQNMTGIYSNHHPFWHTMIIKLIMDLGMAVFHDVSSAVVLYSVFQIICMAAVFAYLCMTMYQAGIKEGWIILTLLIYTVFPYHILYSFSMWKDILFSGAVALFICALYRAIKEIGSRAGNLIILFVSSLGCCLLRSNGMTAFVLTCIPLIFILRSKEKKLLLTLFFALLISFVMKHPVLKMLNIPQPDTAEFLSIPEQQIARLIVEDVDLQLDEIEQIDRVMNRAEVKKQYRADISDPVKDIVRTTDPDYLNEHKWEYLQLWLRLGLRYPDIYLKAWIDQTKGYWNGGYNYWIVVSGVHRNSYGIEASSQNNIISKILEKWVSKFFSVPAFEVFRSIGLHVWIIVLCGLIHLIKRRKEGIICILPLSIVATLLISVPATSEFRYVYALFASFPFLFLTTFTAPDQ